MLLLCFSANSFQFQNYYICMYIYICMQYILQSFLNGYRGFIFQSSVFSFIFYYILLYYRISLFMLFVFLFFFLFFFIISTRADLINELTCNLPIFFATYIGNPAHVLNAILTFKLTLLITLVSAYISLLL